MLFAVLFSAWRLQTADWAEGLVQVRNVAVIGFCFGLGLGYSHYQKRGITLLVLGYTLVILTWQWLGAIAFEDEKILLLERLAILFGKLFTSVKELIAGRPVEDQFFFVTLMSIPYWCASLYSGFQLTRHANFLAVILPNGVLMFIVHVYHYTTRDYTWMFGIYLFLALILLSRLKYNADRKKWVQERVQVSSESGLDITNTTITVAAVMILLAWGTPYVIPPTAEGLEFWHNTYGKIFPPNRFENLFASVEKEGQPKPRNFQTELTLGTRIPQSDLVVFQVYTPQSSSEFPRMYWRGQVYDQYEKGRWQTTSEDEVRRDAADGDFQIPDEGFRRRLSFTFDVRTEGQTILYTAPQPIWVNQTSIMLYSSLPGSPEQEPVFDIMALRASPVLQAGDLYRNSALLANPTISELQEAGSNYPDWVLEKYLQLPDDLSPRIRELALDIAYPYNNPYDITEAVTNYLRTEIQYASIIYLPSDTVDPLDHFLFELKKGYCNYYASAEVVMLRSLGIPARLAVGYAQGEANLQNSLYVVRERDLHAWPEVYFPKYGWVEFEPTVNQDPLKRPETREERPVAAPFINPVNPQEPIEEELTPTPEPTTEEQSSGATLLELLIIIMPWFGGVSFILLLVVLKRRFAPNVTAASMLKRAVEHSGWTPPKWFTRWLVFIELTPIERHFHSINIGLAWMKQPQPVHVTAAERAWILKHLLPSASASIETLLDQLQAQLFSPQGGNDSVSRRAGWHILYTVLQKRLKIAILGYNYAEIQDIPRYPL